MFRKMELSESLEDYLEAILQLQEANKVARAKEIAEKLGVSLASVTASLRKLSERELVNYAPYKFITLTSKGQTIAREILRKHNIIKDFLIRVLTIEPSKADITACRIEHTMDRSAIKKLIEFVAFLDTCPRAGEDWFQNFKKCSATELDWEQCNTCLDECKKRHQQRK